MNTARPIKSSLIYPLVLENELLGVININRTKSEEPFNAASILNMTIFGAQLAQALYNARLFEQLENKVHELKEAYQQLETTQAQLIQSEKLAALGELAAGVAHELNNPLSCILGFAQLLLESHGLNDQQLDDVNTIVRECQRCGQIIQSLLQFSRRSEPQREPLDLVPVIQATIQLARYELIKIGARLVEEFPETPPLVLGDRNQLQQVFLNLITNARHAMENARNGVLTIALREEKDRVVVEFRDTGCGIAPDILKKIFDPFFTTKPVGKGTGLGLSISFGIVQQHHGAIRVESELGKGASFFVDLPRLEQDVVPLTVVPPKAVNE